MVRGGVAVVLLMAAGAAVVWSISGTVVPLWLRRPFNQGDDDEAIRRSTAFLDAGWVTGIFRDGRFCARYIRARALLRRGDLAGALADSEVLVQQADLPPHGRFRRILRVGGSRVALAAHAELYLALALARSGRYEDAEHRALDAMLASAASDTHTWLQALRVLVSTEIRRGMFCSAHLHLDYARATAARAGQFEDAAYVTRLFGALAFAQEDWSGARAAYVDFVQAQVARGAGPEGQSDLAGTLQLLAVVAAQSGAPDDAQRWWSQAQDLIAQRAAGAPALRRGHFHAVTDYHAAVLARLRGDGTAALALATSAAEGFADSDLDLCWFARREIGRAHRDLGDTELARARLTEVLAWFERTGALVEADRTRADLDDLPRPVP